MSILDCKFCSPFKLSPEGLQSRLQAQRDTMDRSDEDILTMCRERARLAQLYVMDDVELFLNRCRHSGICEDLVTKYFGNGPVTNWQNERIAELVYDSYKLKTMSPMEEGARRLLRQDFTTLVHATQMIETLTPERDLSFIRCGHTVYAIRSACEDMPVRRCIVDAVYEDEKYAELDDDSLGDINADFCDIFATEAEAETEAHARGLL